MCTAQYVWPIVGQDCLNADLGGYYEGLRITSGIFSLYRSLGIINITSLKCSVAASAIGALVAVLAAYIHIHVVLNISSLYNKFKSLSLHQLSILFGLGSISFSGHIIHISLPINYLLDSGVDPWTVGLAYHDLLSLSFYKSIFPGFGCGPLIDVSVFLPKGVALLGSSSYMINQVTGCVPTIQVALHHLALGFVLILSSAFGLAIRSLPSKISLGVSSLSRSWHSQLSINLSVTGSLSIAFAHLSCAVPVYPFCCSDYPTMLSLFNHHIWIGGLFIIGGGAHASIFMVRDYSSSLSVEIIICHRDIIVGHLIWVCIALGLHSFGLYVHNDTMQSLGRPEDMFSDNSIQLRPVFAILMEGYVGFDLELLDTKVIRMSQELGTADLIVHHIHSFTIHVTLLILIKGVLYSRCSRLVSDKLELGFRYPCDGPGRGGTCQISPWDHIYLSLFWLYNSHSVVLFHFFWKMQSDVWGSYDSHSEKIVHLSGGDFSTNASTINGWLRNLLWSQSAQAIQSYGTSTSGYGLLFIFAHFVWSFSLMFLFSGRGYWQELIESLVWAHSKIGLTTHIQARALSISQGRAVGLTHYMLGGIACSWSYFLARILTIS
uniref:photosystem I n=1 Tax=Pyrocystis lunula TaxID=2972 RepID=A0A2R4QHC6_PYRLU|nr:photosystem I apoprotein A1 [Pyrocystis lunula]